MSESTTGHTRSDWWQSNLINVVFPYYNQPHRHYHTIYHIHEMFNRAKTLGWNLNIAEMVAIAYHDIVWVAGDDESSVRLSSKLISAHLNGGLLNWADCYYSHDELTMICASAASIVLDTHHHIPLSDLCDSSRVIDLDMFGFACPQHQLDILTRLRSEYCMASNDEFKAGRTNFLLSMLDRAPFFYNLDESYSDIARSTILAELDQMKGLVLHHGV